MKTTGSAKKVIIFVEKVSGFDTKGIAGLVTSKLKARGVNAEFIFPEEKMPDNIVPMIRAMAQRVMKASGEGESSAFCFSIAAALVMSEGEDGEYRDTPYAVVTYKNSETKLGIAVGTSQKRAPTAGSYQRLLIENSRILEEVGDRKAKNDPDAKAFAMTLTAEICNALHSIITFEQSKPAGERLH